MATLQTNQVKSRGPIAGVGGGRQEVVAYASYSLAAALAANDVVQMLWVPAGAIITGVALQVTDLDTGGSPAILLTVGDEGDTDRIIASSNIGQAGGSTVTLANTGMFYQYTADDTIDVLVATGPQTGATTGTIKLAVRYLINPMAS